MNKTSAIALVLVPTLLFGGVAVAQTGSTSNPPDADRIERHCTTGTIGSGAAAQCSDDAVNDGGVVAPRSVLGTENINAAGSSNPASNPSTVPPVVPPITGSVGATSSASPDNPAIMGTPGSLSTNPPSLSNNPPSIVSPGNTGNAPNIGSGGAANTGTGTSTPSAAPAGPAAVTTGKAR